MRSSDISALAQFSNYKMVRKRMLSDWFSADLAPIKWTPRSSKIRGDQGATDT